MSARKLYHAAYSEAWDELHGLVAAAAYPGWTSEVEPLWMAIVELGRAHANSISPEHCRTQAAQIDHETDAGRRIAAAALRMGAALNELGRAAGRYHEYAAVPCRCFGVHPEGCVRCRGACSICGVCGSTADSPYHTAPA